MTWRWPASLMIAAGGAASAASTPPERLLPLSDADAYGTHESGCQSGFDIGRTTYLFVIGRSLIVRTSPGRSGLNVCRITDRQFARFGDGRTAIACAGGALSVATTGQAKSYPEADSVVSPARLTITRHGRSRMVRGTWGTAC